ncbi:glycosyltransferase [Algoriphagus sp.]|uniref:glycosyltransferase n=1 Tax=Algoriphagus sp. TaxID=1872435 RepID=UPI003F6F7C66
MTTEIEVTFNSTIPHNSQLFTGLELLSRNGEINLKYHLNKGEAPFHMVNVLINGKKCIFDFADHALIEEKEYQEADFYVKRMLLKSDQSRLPKLIPFGLNYSVMTKNKFLKYLFLKDRSLTRFSIRYHKLISGLLGVSDSLSNVDVVDFSNAPLNIGKIAFRARLWNPANNPTQWKKEERVALNSERIEILRKLKSTYPSESIGGIEGDDFSNELCPDLVIPKMLSSKKSYLKVLKSSVIGIANQGLEGSIGWKLPEYVAHGMAVITSPISQYALHGNFEEGIHYLSFEDTDSCIAAVSQLMSDLDRRWEMQQANALYYKEYLHPAAKLREIIRLVDEKSRNLNLI